MACARKNCWTNVKRTLCVLAITPEEARICYTVRVRSHIVATSSYFSSRCELDSCEFPLGLSSQTLMQQALQWQAASYTTTNAAGNSNRIATTLPSDILYH